MNDIKWKGPQDVLPVYTHEFSDAGVRKRCTIVTDVADSDGFILVEDAFGRYHLVQKHDLVVIRTERDKWIDYVTGLVKPGAQTDESLAGEIYDAIKSGALKAPEAE